jgi:predicted secreted protein
MASRYIERSVLIFLLFFGLSNSIACAGDYASRQIIGFSPDGRYFAFEQYGVQDGSGFPYSEIFIIDTDADKWVEGSPLRQRIDDDKAVQADVRKQARSQADPLLEKLQITQPGERLASNPRPELSADPKKVVFNSAHQFTPPVTKPVTVSLSEKPVDPGECGQYTDEPIKGFNLTMTPEDGDAIVLHDDKSVPATRGCTLGYAIADVLRHENEGKTAYAILLHVTTVGFEGPNSRFLAVTRRLP